MRLGQTRPLSCSYTRIQLYASPVRLLSQVLGVFFCTSEGTSTPAPQSVWSWRSHLSTLNLRFHVCKLGARVPISRGCGEGDAKKELRPRTLEHSEGSAPGWPCFLPLGPGNSPNPEPGLGIWGRPLGGSRLRWAKRFSLLFTERLVTETAGCAGEAEFPGSGTTSVCGAIDPTRKGAQRCLSEPHRHRQGPLGLLVR